MSEVNLVFYDLIDHLYLHLIETEKFSIHLIGGISSPLTEQWLKKISNCKSLYLFKIYLLSFVTWLDHSILKALVIKSGSDYAQQLLKLFDSKINSYCNELIASFPLLSPNQLVIPLDDSDFTLLALKFCPPFHHRTSESITVLKDVMDIKLIMKRKWKMSSNETHSIQLVAVHTKLELVYWMIPKCLVEVIEKNLIHDWKPGIIMMAVLPINFRCTNVEANSEVLKGPFSSLNCFWEDDTEVDI